MPSVIFFTDISEPEITFLNKVYDLLARKGITLRVVVFKDYRKCIRKLKCDYIYLKTFNLFNLNLPYRKKRNMNTYNDDFLQKLIRLEKEINGREVDVGDYERRLDSLISFVENLTNSASAYFVMSRSYTAYMVVKKVLANRNINFIPFEKWTFAETYQFNKYGIQQPRLDSDLKVNKEEQYRLSLQELFLNYKGRHRINEKKQLLPESYVLLLLSDGCGGSFCLKNVEEYWTLGKGWGNDFEVLSKVERCVQEQFPDSKLLVRQHPYTKYRLEERHINSQVTMLVNDVELDSLLSNADIIVTAPGSISYYSLAKGKKPIILGSGELCGTDAVICVGSVDELGLVLSKAFKNKSAMYVSRENVIDAVMPFFINQVWLNDATFTYQVLTKYVENDTKLQEHISVWWIEKIRIRIHQVYIKIKTVAGFLPAKVRAKIARLLGRNAVTT